MKPYLKQSRKIKKRGFITIKNSLQKGRLFTTQDFIGEHTQWADIFFLSKKRKNIFYNATILTTKSAWHDEVQEQAWEKAGLSDSKGCNPLKSLPPNWMQSLDKAELELAESNSVFIEEQFQILRTEYVFGVGMDIVIHTPTLSVENINHAIEKFYELGEMNWKGQEKYTFSVNDYNDAYNTINPLVTSEN